jgi:diguanylate cyclase (GGDEF)-like protein
MKVWMSRAVDIAFFTGLAFIVAYVDGVTYGSSPTVLFPMVLMSVTGFYMDYFWMIAGLEILMTAVFCVTTIMLRGPAAMPEGLCICLAAMTVSLYSFWCILTEFTDRAYDNRVLKDEGSRDLLTGLLNKVSFEREVRNYLNSRKDNGIGVLIIIDFDNFKRVNDNYGHLVGDEILQKFGKILASNFRVSDIVGRIGGDEFMVLMTGSVPDEIIDKKCSTIEWELQSASVGDARGFSCSMGVAVDRACFRFEELYLFADDALYEAKERGKATFVRRDANPGETPPEHKD